MRLMSTTFSLRPPVSKCRDLLDDEPSKFNVHKKSIRSRSVRCSFLIINPSTYLTYLKNHHSKIRFESVTKLLKKIIRYNTRILTTISKVIYIIYKYKIRWSKINHKIIDQKRKFPCPKQNRRKGEEAKQVELGGPRKRKPPRPPRFSRVAITPI